MASTAFTFDTFPVLETKRLTLRRILLSDADAWLRVLSDERVTAYLVDINQMTSPGNITPIITWADDIFNHGSGLRWAITLTGNDTLIGTCGYQVYSPANSRAEIGYELSSSYWRRGIMSEALHAILAFGFEQLALHRVEADVTEGNQASAGLLRSLGFQQEGTWRDRIYGRGRFWNLWQFGLLRDEYHPPGE